MSTTPEVAAPLTGPADIRPVQRRTLAVLALTQMIGGVGVAVGISVGALLAARMGGTAISGLAQSALVVGAALLAIPATRIMTRSGRRPGLGLAYLVGASGAVLVLFAAAWGNVPLLFVGLFLFGGGSTANLQSRYAAVDLAEPAHRGRQLSLIVWATTIGSVAGPNLAPLADSSVRGFGAVLYSGPFFFSALAFLLAAGLVTVALRPDPLLVARARDASASPAVAPSASAPSDSAPAAYGLRAAAREVLASPSARLGVAAVAVGHAVMISVMAMTPVHIDESGHPDTLRIVGIVLSAHIAGMYALSPVTGWLTDKLGRRGVIMFGIALLVAACLVAAMSGHHTAWLTLGLALLGMGWSATMVAGSTLLTDSVGLSNRASVQGLSDVVMGLAGALAGAASGLIVDWASYRTLALVAAVATVPLLALALRPVAVARA